MKKVLSILLVAIMLFTMVPASVFAAGGISVQIVSFMRGAQDNLRSSELLEARVTGYDGNVRELTYKWTTTLGTYLYVYNSHNMYGINNTDGEVEVYCDEKLNTVGNMEGRNYADSFSGKGYAWASVYGANLTNLNKERNNSLVGTVTVEVFDENGDKLCEDSHEGKFSNKKLSGFVNHDLDADLDNVVIGLFEGEKINALDLLGRSGVVHITCSASNVTSAVVLEGKDCIEVQKEELDTNTYNYYIKGIKAGNSRTTGDAKLNIEVSKGYCKFHQDKSGNAEPIVFVFKKPKTSTTTTTLTLVDDIDDRCTYFINGVEGKKQSDGTIIFTGLTPNTDYTVEVRAEYTDNGQTKYVYGYVDDTTKPVYLAKIYTYIDDTLTDFENIYGDGAELLIRENNDYSEYISLKETSAGVYEAPLYNATFYAWHNIDGVYNKASDYELIVENANSELHLHYYTVNYDTNGGAFKAGEEVNSEIYSSQSAVNATSNIPVREGYVFIGWEYDNKVISSGKQVTASITDPIILKAKWEKAVNVTINVIIDHNSNDGGHDKVETRADLDIDFLEMTAGSPAFVETGDKLHFTKDGVTDENGNKKAYDYSCAGNVSTYTATAATYTGLLDSSKFGVALSKSDYDVGEIKKTIDENGNWIIEVPLKHTPSNFDIDFSVEMAAGVPSELYPDAVIVKVAFWNGTEWEIITQQASTDSVVKPGVRVDIDSVTGKGAGSYPVWKFANNDEAYGYRTVITGFVYGDSTITVPAEAIDGIIATYSDSYYTATMNDVTDGMKYGNALFGAYYDKDEDVQVGTLHGVISVEKYDVTFDANGGKINGKDTTTEEDIYFVPDTDNYEPTFGEHTFLGWYKDTNFKEPAVSGELLTEDITLYAKWDQILTGNVRVAGSYLQDGEMVDVWAVDRAETALVVLQEITEDGVYNIDRQTVDVVWPMSEMIYGISEEYKFTGLDPAKQYRIEILVLNYGTTYQNSTTEYVIDENYADDYNDTDYKAIYPENSKLETFVNAYLSFEPASYFQPIEVDATLIGKNLRPYNTLVQIWYKATGSDNAYQVISQHTVDPFGIAVGMSDDGMDNGDYGYTVWNSVYDGNLYDYQAYLKKINGADASTWPVSVVYGAPSRYSPINDAPTGTLLVKLIPNNYDIIYNENYVDEGVNVVTHGTHTWSFETAINYVPERDGYVFDGWYANPECTGEKVTKIAETVAENTNLYAKWEKKTDLELLVNHVDKANDNVLEIETKTAQIFGDVVTAESLKKDFKGYIFDSASADSVTISTSKNEITLYYVRNNYGYTVNYLEEGTDKVLATAKTASAEFEKVVTETAISIDGYVLISDSEKSITIDTENNVINFYYAADNSGGGEDGDNGDGTPDKYQKKVIFKVVNGTWADGTTADKFAYLDLMKDGKHAVDGTATLTAPTGMIANEGFEGGAWDVIPPAIVSGTNDETYTYIFTERAPDTPDTPDTPDIPDTPDTPEGDGEGEGNGNGSIGGGSHHILFGKTDGIGWYHVSKDGGQTYDIVFGNSTYEVEHGTEIIVKVGDVMGDSFVFYVNGDKYYPDENGNLVITVNGYMLIGALGFDFEVPDVEESLNWFQRIIKAIKDFFAKLFGKNK